MYRENHPEFVRWGLNLFGFPNNCFYHNVNCVRRGITEPDRRTVENDEVIAHALQEEIYQLSDAESSGNPQHASFLAQDYNYGYMGSSSTSYPDSKEYYEGDSEVGRRLNNMVSVRHVPKINGAIPSVDDATSDHERLLQRLKMYDYVEKKVEGDGNCQFRAISDQFYGSTEHHEFVRGQIVNQLKSHPEIYSGYVPMDYSQYLKKLSNNAEWGDHVTLQAAADAYGIKIFLITSFKNQCYIEILPNVQKSKRVIFLSFWAEVHYNSIYPEGGLQY